jgi:hypothetical protein
LAAGELVIIGPVPHPRQSGKAGKLVESCGDCKAPALNTTGVQVVACLP